MFSCIDTLNRRRAVSFLARMRVGAHGPIIFSARPRWRSGSASLKAGARVDGRLFYHYKRARVDGRLLTGRLADFRPLPPQRGGTPTAPHILYIDILSWGWPPSPNYSLRGTSTISTFGTLRLSSNTNKQDGAGALDFAPANRTLPAIIRISAARIA